jgi:hypothetical protein
VRVFNKPCNRKDWEDADKPSFLYFSLTEWISDENKAEGGYLKTWGYKEAFQQSYNNASDSDKALLLKLPNFDADVFFEISGIRI